MKVAKLARRAILLFTLILLLPTTLTQAAIQIDDPSFSPDDWFEYDGYSESLTANLTETWGAATNFQGITLGEVSELRITHRGSEGCTILSWSGDCIKTEITHTVNFTVNWHENTTNYDNDTLNMSVSLTATHWQARGSEGWEKLDSTTTTVTQFTGGGEENYLEHEIREVSLTERNGMFPDRFAIGFVWDVEERVEIHGTERIRENRGLWNESEYNRSVVTQVTYSVLGEQVVLYGEFNEKSHDTLAVQRVDLADNTTTIDFYRGEGFLARTERWNNGTLLLSATLVDYRYYVDEPHDANLSTNSLMSILIACFGVLILIGVGATWFGLSIAPKPRMIAPEIPVITDGAAGAEDDKPDGHDPLDDLDL